MLKSQRNLPTNGAASVQKKLGSERRGLSNRPSEPFLPSTRDSSADTEYLEVLGENTNLSDKNSISDSRLLYRKWRTGTQHNSAALKKDIDFDHFLDDYQHRDSDTNMDIINGVSALTMYVI